MSWWDRFKGMWMTFWFGLAVGVATTYVSNFGMRQPWWAFYSTVASIVVILLPDAIEGAHRLVAHRQRRAA
ncbi:MAG: hypothetical protein JWM57_3373 [Phycisphaerales bacterium]|nr:hypothetical protein [Phycisphaerales bacterium]